VTEFGQSLLQKMKDMGVEICDSSDPDIKDYMTKNNATFIGEVSDPFCSPKITKCLVEFKVRSIQGSLLLYKTAQLISEAGEVCPVMVRAISIMHPSRDPREFQLRVDGIDIEKAKTMRRLIQEHNPD
jgi:hypothetical protein